MALAEMRGDPSTVDAQWLTTVLESGGVARGGRVVDIGPLAFVGTGQTGRNVRFPLEWDEPDGRPTSVVGKFPTEDEAARTAAFGNGTYYKEHVFYSRLRSTVDIRTPDVYAALYDEATPDFVILMEDLADSVQGDQLQGFTVDQAALAVEQAVALHAPRWGDESLTGITGATREESAQLLEAVYGAMLEGTLERFGSRLDEESITLARDLAPVIGRWALGTGTPSTLVHLDFRPDNFLFGTTPDAPPLAVVDWQTIAYGLATSDVAYLLGGSFEPDERAEVERELLEEYRGRLRAAGIDYDRDTCWRDYRFGTVWGVAISVIATMLAEQTERGDELLATMLRRAAHHVLDLDAVALLR
jgi:hypothetical protein